MRWDEGEDFDTQKVASPVQQVRQIFLISWAIIASIV